MTYHFGTYKRGMMTPQEKGGQETKARHGITVCSKCGAVHNSGYYGDIGSKGGNETLRRHGREHYRAIGKRGGRPKVVPK